MINRVGGDAIVGGEREDRKTKLRVVTSTYENETYIQRSHNH